MHNPAITTNKTRRIQLFLELAAITMLTLLFMCLSTDPIDAFSDGLDLSRLTLLVDPTYRQTGLEHERLSGVLLPVKIGLARYGHIPLWNPYMGGGEPIINNAFSYLFNPFHSLPVLLSDSFAQGTKIATIIALLIAGYNMWVLMYTFGIGAVGRIAAGALYLMNGAIAGKFYAGHFQLALSLAWPPLVLAALWWTLRSKSRLAPVVFGLSFALLFLAGNIYYVLHTLICAAVIALFHLVERKPRIAEGESQHSALSPQHYLIRWDHLRRVAIASLFAFGLAALQFFPVWLTRDYVDHDVQKFNADGSLEGNYDFAQAIAFFTSPAESLRLIPGITYERAIAVDYTYLGTTIFLLIAAGGIIILIRRRFTTEDKIRWRVIAIACILIPLMMIWGAGQSSILSFLYARVSLLSEFRFLGRAHAIAALWWIVLAGVAIDSLWNAARDLLKTPTAFDRHDSVRLTRAIIAATAVWLYFVVYSGSITSNRLSMVFNNVRWLNALDQWRFTSLKAAAGGLWIFILVAIVLDTLLLLIGATVGRWRSTRVSEMNSWRVYATRLLRIAVLALLFSALNDIMAENSRLYKVEIPTTSFAAIYPYVKQADPDPFPAINLPFSPGAFEVYEAELRNWGLNEGWIPNSIDGLFSWDAGTLFNLPRWAIVSNAYGGSSQDYAQRVVDDNSFSLVDCYALENAPGDPCDPCKMDGGMAAVLYERDDVLPYTFVVPAEALLTLPGKLRANTVYPAQMIAHRQDSIQIQAQKPPAAGDYYLIIQEANFPGWQVQADGIRLEAKTAQTYRDPLSGDRGYIAVLMPEGAETYTFWFEPPGFTLGLIITIVTILVIMAWYSLRKQS